MNKPTLFGKLRRKNASFATPWLKTVLILIICLMIPLTTIFFVSNRHYNRMLEQAVLTNHAHSLYAMTDFVDELMSNLNGIRDDLAVDRSLRPSYSPTNYPEASDLQQRLNVYSCLFPDLSSILMHTADDEYLFSATSSFSADTLSRRFQLDDDVIRRVFANDYEIPLVMRSHDRYFTRDCLLFFFSFDNQRIPRTLIISVPASEFSDMAYRSGAADGSYVFLYDQNGALLDYSYSDPAYQASIAGQIEANETFRTVNCEGVPLTVDRQDFFVSSRQTRQLGLRIVQVSPAETAIMTAVAQKNNAMLLFFAALLLTAVMVFPTAHLIYSPIRKLMDHVHGTDRQTLFSSIAAPLYSETDSIISYMEQIKNRNEALSIHLEKLHNDWYQTLFTRLLLKEINSWSDFSDLQGAERVFSASPRYVIFAIRFSQGAPNAAGLNLIREQFVIDGETACITMPHPESGLTLGLILMRPETEARLKELLSSAAQSLHQQLRLPFVLGVGGIYTDAAFACQAMVEAACACGQPGPERTPAAVVRFALSSDDRVFEDLLSVLSTRSAAPDPTALFTLLDRVSGYLTQPDCRLSRAKYLGFKTLVFLNHYVSMSTDSEAVNLYPYASRLIAYTEAEDVDRYLKKFSAELLKKTEISPTERRSVLHSEMLLYIEQHISDADFSLTAMADHFSMSLPILTKYFRDKTDMSIASYMTLKRMEKACDLLANSSLPVREIGIAVGYLNDSSFIRRFKSVMGISPGQYRSAPDQYRLPVGDMKNDESE